MGEWSQQDYGYPAIREASGTDADNMPTTRADVRSGHDRETPVKGADR